MLQFLSDNWPIILASFVVLEKIVKVTPTKYDDIFVDILLYALQLLLGKITKKPTP